MTGTEPPSDGREGWNVTEDANARLQLTIEDVSKALRALNRYTGLDKLDAASETGS
jgi:hypothetical protein